MALGSVTFGGLASGLPSDIVDQMMQAEQIRLQSYSARKSEYQTEKSAFTTLSSKLLSLKSKMEDFQDVSNLSPKTSTSSDEDKMTVSASSTAMEGVHTIAIANLATYDTHATEGISSSSLAWDETETTANGTAFQFTYQGKSFSFDGTGTDYSLGVTDGMTLANIAETINDFDFGDSAVLNDEDEDGIAASIMFDGSNYRMVMTARNSGASNNITINQGDLSFDDGLGVGTFETIDVANNVDTVGLDASMTVNGVPVTSSDNTVDDVIPGVTLTLLETTTTDLTININNDSEALKTTVQEFVDSYNDVISYINSEKSNSFSGESLVRSVIYQMRNELNSATSDTDGTSLTGYSRLASMGIETDSSGKLSIDSSTWDDAVVEDYEGIINIFSNEMDTSGTGTEGLAFRLEDLIDDLTQSSTGTIAAKTSGLDSRIDSVEDRMIREQTRLEKVRERMTLKFANLEQLMNNMNGSSGAMMQSLSNL